MVFPRIPKKLGNELKVFAIFLEEPDVGFNEAHRKSFLPRTTFRRTLNRLVEGGILEKTAEAGRKSKYEVNEAHARSFLIDLSARLTWDEELTQEQEKLLAEIERHSIEFPGDFGSHWKFDSYEEFKTWLGGLPDDWALGHHVKRLFETQLVPKLERILPFNQKEMRRIIRDLERATVGYQLGYRVKIEGDRIITVPPKGGADIEAVKKLKDEGDHDLRATVDVCPECGCTRAIFDRAVGETSCTKCGLIIERI